MSELINFRHNSSHLDQIDKAKQLEKTLQFYCAFHGLNFFDKSIQGDLMELFEYHENF